MSDITFKHHDPNVMLELWHVTKRFGGLTAVGDVSFKIKKGEIYALIGSNGAGKTTIFNLITGVYALTEGRVIFDGTVVGQGDAIIKDDMRETDVKPFRKQPYDIMSRGMARTFQNIRLFKSETVYNNVLTACHAEADYNIFQSLWRLKVGPKWLTKYYYQEKALREKTEELLKIMGIWEQRDMIAVNLPYGQQRKLEIARALATDPKLLLLDEPAAGMNPEETLALMDLHPRDPRPLRPDRAHHRASHGPRDERLRPHLRAQLRQASCRGNARGDPEQPRGHRGLSRKGGRRRWRCLKFVT